MKDNWINCTSLSKSWKNFPYFDIHKVPTLNPALQDWIDSKPISFLFLAILLEYQE